MHLVLSDEVCHGNCIFNLHLLESSGAASYRLEPNLPAWLPFTMFPASYRKLLVDRIVAIPIYLFEELAYDGASTGGKRSTNFFISVISLWRSYLVRSWFPPSKFLKDKLTSADNQGGGRSYVDGYD